MSSEIATKIAAEIHNELYAGIKIEVIESTFAAIIDGKLAPAREALREAERWVPFDAIEAVPITGSDKPVYESRPHPLKAKVRAALASLEVK